MVLLNMPSSVAGQLLLTLSRRGSWATAADFLSLPQGRLGNCYYLAAISSCADGDDDVLLKDLIIEDGIAQARRRHGPSLAQ
jgi:hypothetical protein